jgi:predicted PurR-regulated permease PerM
MNDKSTAVAYRSAAWLVAFVALWLVLKHGQTILMPLVLAIFTSILIFPIVTYLVARRIPGFLAIILAQLVGFLPVALMVLIFLATVGPVRERITDTSPSGYPAIFSTRLDQTLNRFAAMMEPFWWKPHVEADDHPGDNGENPGDGQDRPDEDPGVMEGPPAPAPPPDPKQAFVDEMRLRIKPWVIVQGAGLAQSVLGTTPVILTTLVLVVLLTTFILIEARRFGEKAEEAFSKENPILVSMTSVAKEVRTYVIAKTLISAATGLLVWILLSYLQVDFAGFWGLVTFILNFIPNVGSLIAAIPPILVAWITQDLWVAVKTAVGLTCIQLVLGSFLDPRIVGAQLKLSPLVIILSMIAWGLLWGPIGMILSVPIMVSVKIVCSHVEGLQPIATLLQA